jgi:hypothetical protein
MTKTYVSGTEPDQPDKTDQEPQEQAEQSNTGVSGTTHGGRSSKDSAKREIAAIKQMLKS